MTPAVIGATVAALVLRRKKHVIGQRCHTSALSAVDVIPRTHRRTRTHPHSHPPAHHPQTALRVADVRTLMADEFARS